jgi:hypothetical protein
MPEVEELPERYLGHGLRFGYHHHYPAADLYITQFLKKFNPIPSNTPTLLQHLTTHAQSTHQPTPPKPISAARHQRLNPPSERHPVQKIP